MTRSVDAPPAAMDSVPPSGPTAVRVPESLRRVAVSRLYQGPRSRRLTAADRLLEAAGAHGIRPDLIWGTLDAQGSVEPVRQMVMGVPGSGRTALLFLSPPGAAGELGDSSQQRAELAACVRAALTGLTGREAVVARGSVGLVQALPEPHETWSINACLEGGMTMVGELAYMRRAYTARDRRGVPAPWPEGIEVRTAGPHSPSADDLPDVEALRRALDASYVDTLDCPELCGLRRTDDVIESHMSTGVFDPSTWWIAYADGEPLGCVLMSHCPEHDSVELVYLGLGSPLRGRGLGEALLRGAIARTVRHGAAAVTCAVDRRNVPAVSLYERLGFRVFASRVALVCAAIADDS